MSKQDEILRAYAILSSLAKNLPTWHEVDSTWVNEYHLAIEKLELASGSELSEFKISQADLHRAVASWSYVSGEKTYRDGLWVTREKLMHRIEEVLNYFEIVEPQPQGKIGFRDPSA